jgi:protein-disulfide isomerase
MARKLVLFGGALILALLVGIPSVEAAPKGPKISVGDDPSMKEGSPGLVLVEVSDFQCPFCGRSARDVLPQVYEKFVRSGKVELIYLDLPLQMHAYAFKAAEAAACAGDQNMFWDMHHQLFENQGSLSPEKLPGYAAALELDVAAFQKCLSGGKHAPGIREDMRTAQNLGITGTPAYLLGRRIPGGDKIQVLEIVKGVPKYEALEEKINALLTAK